MEDQFIAYKEAIKTQYEIEKNGDNADCLLHPTLAKLRKLCIRILKKNTNDTDTRIFEKFFEVELGPDSIKKIKDEDNRFRRFEKFLKNQTDLSDDMYAADFLALLVNYKYRPYPKFKKHIENLPLLEKEKKEVLTNSKESFATTFYEEDLKIGNTPIEEILDLTITEAVQDRQTPHTATQENATLLNPVAVKQPKHKTLIVFLFALSLLTGGYIAKDVCFPEKQCMQWQEDHYENVSCEVKDSVSISPIIALDKEVVNLKKVNLKKGMVLFKYKKPLYYYHKVAPDSVEFFNAPGLHPITGKPLREITWYMIHKYVK